MVRTSLIQVTQLGVESVPGTLVTATKRLGSISLSFNPKVSAKSHTPAGYKFPLAAVKGKDYTEGSFDGLLDYNELCYILSSLLVYAAPTGAGTTKTWTHKPGYKSLDTLKTYSAEHGESSISVNIPHLCFSSLNLDITRDEVKVSGNVLGQKMATAAGVTGALADPVLVPATPDDFILYVADTYAGLAAGQIDAYKISLSLDRGLTPTWPVNSAKPSFSTVAETKPNFKLKLSFEANAAGMAFLDKLRAGSTVFIKLVGTSASIVENSTAYSMTMEMSAKVLEPSELSDSDGVYSIEYTFEPSYTSDIAGGIKFVLVNSLAAL